MGISKTEINVTWESSDKANIAASSDFTSDAFPFDADAVEAMIVLKSSSTGTAVSGDTVDTYIEYTIGDPDSTSSSTGVFEYDSKNHSNFLAQLNVNDDNPAIGSVWIPTSAYGARLYTINNSTASHKLSISASVYETRLS